MGDTIDDLIVSLRKNSHTIDSLIQALEKAKAEGACGDTAVVMAKGADADGREYSPLESLDIGMYLPINTWSGLHYLTDSSAHPKAVPAVFLWPTD